MPVKCAPFITSSTRPTLNEGAAYMLARRDDVAVDQDSFTPQSYVRAFQSVGTLERPQLQATINYVEGIAARSLRDGHIYSGFQLDEYTIRIRSRSAPQ
jgi:hypothetical protein